MQTATNNLGGTFQHFPPFSSRAKRLCLRDRTNKCLRRAPPEAPVGGRREGAIAPPHPGWNAGLCLRTARSCSQRLAELLGICRGASCAGRWWARRSGAACLVCVHKGIRSKTARG
eukprot:15444759-Alexandrium_andersonii.AAC.1